MPQFKGQELQSQIQLKDVSEKPERSQRCLWGNVFNQSPGRCLRDLQIIPLWDVSETLYDTSQRCIWGASMPAGLECFQQSQSSIERSENTHVNEKENIWNIHSNVSYVWCKTITWRKDLLRKMDVFQNNIMRTCTNKRKIGRTSINTLLTMVRFTSVSTLVKRKKLTWFGHLKRSDLPVRAVYEGMVSGKWRRGRPIRRWRNDIYGWTGRTIAELISHMWAFKMISFLN